MAFLAMKRYRLLALDLDGTLLTSDLRITQSTLSALRAAKEAGVVVAVATGRMYISALPYAKELAMDIPLIAHNGAMIKGSLSGEVISSKPLPGAVLGKLIEDLRVEGLPFMAYYDSSIYVERGFLPASNRYVKFTRVEATLVDDMVWQLPGLPLSIGVRGEAQDVDRVYVRLKDKFSGELHMVKSFPSLLEIHHPHASKGHALEELSHILGITPNEVIAVGDNLNDLEMLRVAGLGIAMGNAPQDVKDIADYVAPSNDEDGVVHVVENFILSQVPEKIGFCKGKEGEEATIPGKFQVL